MTKKKAATLQDFFSSVYTTEMDDAPETLPIRVDENTRIRVARCPVLDRTVRFFEDLSGPKNGPKPENVPSGFWVTVCKTVRLMLSVRCLSCPVCNVRALWPNS